jgi:MFS family permease
VIIGNALEWYDFTLYGYFTVTIAKLFFPAHSPWTSLLSALAAFGVAFVVRPFGGLFLAQRADRWGRKGILIFVIGLMTIGTALMAATPTYAAIGIAAPLIIVASRLCQGFAAGGEFASATAFLVEQAPERRRGLYGAWQFSGQGMAILLAGVAGWLSADALAPAAFESWGWRVPFLVGLVAGPVGYYMRLKLNESPAFIATANRETKNASPLREVFITYKRRVLIGLGLVVGGSGSLYVLFVFMPTYAVKVLGLDLKAALLAPIAAGLAVAIFCPIMGRVSDTVGRKPCLIVSAVGLLAALYPCFIWLQQETSVERLVVVEFFFGLLFSIGGGPFNAALAEMFPPQSRVTGMAVAYNFGVALFGGLAPFAVAWLIARTGDPLAPMYYVVACVFVSFIAAWALPARLETKGAVSVG